MPTQPVLTREEREALAKAGVTVPTPTPTFEGLGRSGVDSLGGKLEWFEAPKGIAYVELVSDEVTALCPVTGQPDFYRITITYNPDERCVESKSLKLYFQSFRQNGRFGEQFAVDIADHFFEEIQPLNVDVVVWQKSRGGITIETMASRTKETSS